MFSVAMIMFNVRKCFRVCWNFVLQKEGEDDDDDDEKESSIRRISSKQISSKQLSSSQISSKQISSKRIISSVRTVILSRRMMTSKVGAIEAGEGDRGEEGEGRGEREGEDEEEGEEGEEEEEEEEKLTMYKRLKVFIMNFKMGGRVKILIGTFQIITGVETTLHIGMPANFQKFASYFSFLNIDILSYLPFQCSESSWDYINTLLLTTLLPIFLALVLLVYFSCNFFYKRYFIMEYTLSSAEILAKEILVAYNKAKSQFFAGLFYVTFLALPAVSTVIFTMFLCTDLDGSADDTSTSTSTGGDG